MEIIADVREPDSIVKRLHVPYKKQFLQVGDYVIGDVVIERKSHDLIPSLTSKRIFNQLSNLAQAPHPILVIENTNLWRDMYFNENKHIHKSLYGFLFTVAVKFKIPVIKVDSREEFIELLESIYYAVNKEGTSSRPIFVQRKPTTLGEIQENMLAQIPGISIKKAQNLLEKFNGILGVVLATEKDLVETSGIGKKLAKQIVEVWNYDYKREKEKNRGANKTKAGRNQ